MVNLHQNNVRLEINKTRLSVNINKIATLRNARGGNLPDLIQVAKDCEAFGAEGITIHPRPDQRHIRYSDVPLLKEVVTTEFNIEGYPNPKFMELVLANKPDQCTLVPDSPEILTSDKGWDTIENESFLTEIINELKAANIRVSVFLDPEEKQVEGAKKIGADRIEFYTGDYAKQYYKDKHQAISSHVQSARLANKLDIGINAGHDLNLDNLKFYKNRVEGLLEVSIGHALICDSIYLGLHNTIQLYLKQLATLVEKV